MDCSKVDAAKWAAIKHKTRFHIENESTILYFDDLEWCGNVCAPLRNRPVCLDGKDVFLWYWKCHRIKCAVATVRFSPRLSNNTRLAAVVTCNVQEIHFEYL